MALGLLLPGIAQAGKLEVVVAKVRNGKGHVRVAACSVDTFLNALIVKSVATWDAPATR